MYCFRLLLDRQLIDPILNDLRGELIKPDVFDPVHISGKHTFVKMDSCRRQRDPTSFNVVSCGLFKGYDLPSLSDELSFVKPCFGFTFDQPLTLSRFVCACK